MSRMAIISAAALAVFAALVVPHAASAGTLSVSATDRQRSADGLTSTERPLVGAAVAIDLVDRSDEAPLGPLKRRKTDENGNADFPYLAPGVYRVSIMTHFFGGDSGVKYVRITGDEVVYLSFGPDELVSRPFHYFPYNPSALTTLVDIYRAVIDEAAGSLPDDQRDALRAKTAKATSVIALAAAVSVDQAAARKKLADITRARKGIGARSDQLTVIRTFGHLTELLVAPLNEERWLTPGGTRRSATLQPARRGPGAPLYATDMARDDYYRGHKLGERKAGADAFGGGFILMSNEERDKLRNSKAFADGYWRGYFTGMNALSGRLRPGGGGGQGGQGN